MTPAPAETNIRKVHLENGVTMWHGKPSAQERFLFYWERERQLLAIGKRTAWQEMALQLTRERISLLTRL